MAKAVLALAKAKKSALFCYQPRIFLQPEIFHSRICSKPIAIDNVRILARKIGGIVIGGTDFILIGHPPRAIDVEDGADVALAESIGHLFFGLERPLAFEDALRLLVILLRGMMQPRFCREMRMAIEIAHWIGSFLLVAVIENAFGLAFAAAVRPFHERVFRHKFDIEAQTEVGM